MCPTWINIFAWLGMFATYLVVTALLNALYWRWRDRQ
jgi:hypothetical protein